MDILSLLYRAFVSIDAYGFTGDTFNRNESSFNIISRLDMILCRISIY